MYNKVTLLGRLGADPESKFTPSGSQIVNLRLATSEKWNDKQGNLQERTEWCRVVVFDKLAKTCADYLEKGRTVLVEGRLQTRSWETTSGEKRFMTEVVASVVRFVGGGEGGQRRPDEPNAVETVTPPLNDDDIPF